MSAPNSLLQGVTLLRPEIDASDAVDKNGNPRPRILIVDDISDNRTILTRRFQRRGFDVLEADNGLTAIELIAQGPFDLVLLDVMMPGIDGIETLKRIRDQRSPSALPVIMVTAKSESTNIVDALELGANDYVTKPVDFAVALARVNTQISRKRAEQQVSRVNDELRKANEDLERRVEERTRRLIDANQRLKVEIADREESQARSQYLAYHDSLTGLGNRLLFKEQLEEALKDVSVTPHPFGGSISGSRRLQGGQRHAWSFHRRPASQIGRGKAPRYSSAHRPYRATWRRRVCDIADVGRPACFVDRAGGKDHRNRRSTLQCRRSRRNGGSQRWGRRRPSRRYEYGNLPEERRSCDV